MRNFVLLLLCIFIPCVFLQCNEKPFYYEPSRLENAIGKFWSKDPSMALAIRNAESDNGRLTLCYERTNIYYKEWVQRIPGIKEKRRMYGIKAVVSSRGDFQVFYPSALYYGFKGSPYELEKDIDTNAKYSRIIYEVYEKTYSCLDDVISAYNRGYAWIYYVDVKTVKEDGTIETVREKRYHNRKYVMMVKTNYLKWRMYERD